MATSTRPFNITAPTTTAAPTTAAEARKLADDLAARETSLAKAQREARDAATFAAAETILATDAAEAAADRDSAVAAWDAAAADPAATLDELFSAFVAMKAASATRAAIVAQANGILNAIRPLRSEVSGQPTEYRNDVVDYLQHVEFGAALEDVIRARAERAADIARADVQTRSTTAGEQAAAKVKA